MTDDPPRLRLDPETPGGLSELMAHGAPPPRLDAATKAASAAAVATLAGGTAAAATTAGASAVGTKAWLVVGGLVVTGLVTGGVVIGVGMGSSEAPTATASEPLVAAHRTESTPQAIEAPVEVVPAMEELPAPVEPAPARAVSRRARRQGRAEPSAVRSGGGLVAEAALLEEARGLLARAPAAALAATERHRREHPRAQLAAEREFIAIDALRRLGRSVPARRRAQRLIEHSPSGIYAERARAILRDLPQ